MFHNYTINQGIVNLRLFGVALRLASPCFLIQQWANATFPFCNADADFLIHPAGSLLLPFSPGEQCGKNFYECWQTSVHFGTVHLPPSHSREVAAHKRWQSIISFPLSPLVLLAAAWLVLGRAVWEEIMFTVALKFIAPAFALDLARSIVSGPIIAQIVKLH